MNKVDRRVVRTQDAIKKAFLELMSEKSFDHMTIQDLADRANVNRATVYLHYLDKFDLLDKIIEEHMENMLRVCELEAELDWIDSTVLCMEYLEQNRLFFSTMLASEGAPYFRSRFIRHNIESFAKDIDVTQGKNEGQNPEVIAEFVANAYVGVVEWWIRGGMKQSPRELAVQVGALFERVV